MAITVNGLTPCPGGDCHGIDHAWCAPGRHVAPYDQLDERLRARSCMTCGQPEYPHPVRHPFKPHRTQVPRHAKGTT